MEKLHTVPIDLSCEILGNKFKNPIWLGSGSLVDSIEKTEGFLSTSIGAIVPRTTRLQYASGRERHPSPHLEMNLRRKRVGNKINLRL